MGAYEFIEDQIELFGDEYVNSMLDKGFEPSYIPPKGWVWLQVQRDTVTV